MKRALLALTLLPLLAFSLQAEERETQSAPSFEDTGQPPVLSEEAEATAGDGIAAQTPVDDLAALHADQQTRLAELEAQALEMSDKAEQLRLEQRMLQLKHDFRTAELELMLARAEMKGQLERMQELQRILEHHAASLEPERKTGNWIERDPATGEVLGGEGGAR